MFVTGERKGWSRREEGGEIFLYVFCLIRYDTIPQYLTAAERGR